MLQISDFRTEQITIELRRMRDPLNTRICCDNYLGNVALTKAAVKGCHDARCIFGTEYWGPFISDGKSGERTMVSHYKTLCKNIENSWIEFFRASPFYFEDNFLYLAPSFLQRVFSTLPCLGSPINNYTANSLIEADFLDKSSLEYYNNLTKAANNIYISRTTILKENSTDYSSSKYEDDTVCNFYGFASFWYSRWSDLFWITFYNSNKELMTIMTDEFVNMMGKITIDGKNVLDTIKKLALEDDTRLSTLYENIYGKNWKATPNSNLFRSFSALAALFILQGHLALIMVCGLKSQQKYIRLGIWNLYIS
ncbi:hypothetical protein FACS1894113_2930 [Alphaproteobacteria bacterium]|nr:hypothetical protein FACS1894113_2930 [Alphaproteobacteria bacterium]